MIKSVKIKFLGAVGTVTGSAYLLTSNEGKVLIDFGLFQGPSEIAEQNYLPLSFDPREITGVLLTHAHLDHCGRLPILPMRGLSGKIYMTRATRELVGLSLTDAANVAEKNGEIAPLYGLPHVEKALEHIETVEYRQEFSVGPFRVTYRDAGHILGSASIEVGVDGKKLIFSGDLGNTPEDIVKPTEFIRTGDVVVMESTYGDTLHSGENPSSVLSEEIKTIEYTDGVLLIPAFSLERTQELLHRIHHLKKSKKIKDETPVFLDSPMGSAATRIFLNFREFYNDEMASHTDDPFSFPNLFVTKDASESKKIKKVRSPKVIIAGSGMMTGGRILYHVKEYAPRKTTRILFVGYQAEETLGRDILDGAQTVRVRDRVIRVKAKIREIDSMSSHADSQKLLNWVGAIGGAKKVFLTHGEDEVREALAAKIKSDVKINDVALPIKDEEFEIV